MKPIQSTRFSSIQKPALRLARMPFPIGPIRFLSGIAGLLSLISFLSGTLDLSDWYWNPFGTGHPAAQPPNADRSSRALRTPAAPESPDDRRRLLNRVPHRFAPKRVCPHAPKQPVTLARSPRKSAPQSPTRPSCARSRPAVSQRARRPCAPARLRPSGEPAPAAPPRRRLATHGPDSWELQSAPFP